MDSSSAITALGALAQPTRLAAFRLLVETGPEGMPAGDVARALGAPQNTVSTHLGTLAAAGLVQGRREGRSVRYAVDMPGVRALLAYLLEDCCRGRPEACAPLLDAALPACCPTPERGAHP